MNKRLTLIGFTLIEMLITLSLLALVATLSIIGFQNFARFQQYNQAVSDVTFVLEQARLSARSAVADESHGVKLDTASLTEFTGSTFVGGDPDNIVHTYGLITLQHGLTGGADEIVFQKLTGLPSATGTVTVVGAIFTASTTIEITGAGVVQ